MIRWVAAYHYTWLKRNPAFFAIEKFWSRIEQIRNEPQLIHGYRRLPTKNGDIDWDVVSEDYHHYILGPFSPEMTTKDSNGKTRNLLLNYINDLPPEDLSQMEVADFGCGPGNLIPYIAGKVKSLNAIDKSQNALNIAEAVAKKTGIAFTSMCTDILALDCSQKYDLVISVNSVLPQSREDVVRMFTKMRDCLKPSGRLIAILPSFDTTVYLSDLWTKYYRKSGCDDNQVKRISTALEETKQVNTEALSYADDGLNIQCYHTESSINKEFAQSGLRLLNTPERVHYPWSLTKRFDYGFFPDENEEIWDWFVVAERTTPH